MIAQFALRLICGMSLMWALMPRRQVTSGFFRIQMLVVMGLGVLAALAMAMEAQSASQMGGSAELVGFQLPPIVIGLPAGLIALCGFLGSAFWTLERRTAGARIGFGVLALSAGLLVLTNSALEVTIYTNDTFVKVQTLGSTTTWTWQGVVGILSEFAGSAVLGGTVVGMLLGHWYLTSPTMSIEPLKRINLFLGISGLLRLVVSILAMVCVWSEKLNAANHGSELPAFMSVPPAWLGLRWLAGVIGPLVVSLMVWRILKYRNTQAATGVLFVGVILAFIGDMTAALLLRETGLPL
jgi:hypothetical protein